MPTPMRSQFTRLLNDLFMAFHQRSVGAAAALIKAVQAEAKAQGCGVVLWIIHGHNYWVRSLYDKLAEKNWLGALWNGRSGGEMNVILTSWIAPFGVGFTLSFSLILAIGAQNTFVLRQGLMRQHIGALVLFCALSDAMLIIVGVGGMASLMEQWLITFEQWLFAGAALWLGVYGLIRGYDAWRGHRVLHAESPVQNGLMTTLAMAAVLTFGNPHVYLDTMVLIGTVSLQFADSAKIAFAVGAASASFVFFVGLGYGAAALSGIMQRQNAWRILDAAVAAVMLVLAFGMASAGGWV